MDKFPEDLTPDQCPPNGVSKEKLRHLRQNITQHLRNNRQAHYTLHLKEKYNTEELKCVADELTELGWVVTYTNTCDNLGHFHPIIKIGRK